MSSRRVVAIVQARLGSSRLPGKVLKEVASGWTVLGLCLARLRRAWCIDAVMVATSNDPEDNELATWLETEGVPFVRGPEEDVLARYIQALAHPIAWDATHVVRITSDCPLIDPTTLDRTVEACADGVDYAANIIDRRDPRGLDVEVVTVAALHRADAAFSDPAIREHVTYGILRDPERFIHVSSPADADASEYRWTVDTAEDLELIRRLAGSVVDPVTADRQAYLDVMVAHPDWRTINQHIRQKEFE